MGRALDSRALLEGLFRDAERRVGELVKGSALDIPAKPSTSLAVSFWRALRAGPLCGFTTRTKFAFQAA